VVDTETGEILSGGTPYVPSYGGHLRLNEDATKAFVTSRFNNEVTVLTVAAQGQALYCEVEGEPAADSRPCQVTRLPDVRGGNRLAIDPFGLAVTRAIRTIGGEEQVFDLVHVSHLRGEQVSSMSFPEGEIPGASLQSAALVSGGNQVVNRPGTQDLYVAGRSDNVVAAYRPYINENGQVEAIVRREVIELARREDRVDARGIGFDETGDWLYVATRRPNALHVIGMEAGANRTPRVVRSIPLEQNPSELVVHEGADGVRRIYIPSYRHGLIQVVDAEQEAVVDVIEVGRNPYHMVVDSPVHCRVPGERCQAYVSLFDVRAEEDRRCQEGDESCGRIAVLDLDPASETFHTVIDWIY
jgi:hypothetical protein